MRFFTIFRVDRHRVENFLPRLCIYLFVSLLASAASAQVPATFDISQSGGYRVIEVVNSGTSDQIVVNSPVKLNGSKDAQLFLTPKIASSLFFVKAGGVLEISDIEIRANEGAKSAIVLDGGTVILNRCLISGNFASAIDVINGNLIIRNCAITGSDFAIVARNGSQVDVEQVVFSDQKNSAIWGDSAKITFTGVDFRNAGLNPVNLKSSSAFTLSDASFAGNAARFIQVNGGGTNVLTELVFQGSANTAIFLKNAGLVEVSDVRIASVDIASGIWVVGATDVEFSRIKIDTRDRAIEVNNVTGRAILKGIEIVALPESIGIFAENVDNFALRDTNVIGGAIGLFLRGGFRDFEMSRNIFAGQKETSVQLRGVDVSQDVPAAILGNTLVSDTGAVLDFSGISRAFVKDNRIASTGQVPIIGDITDGIFISGNSLLLDTQIDTSWISQNEVVAVDLLTSDQISARRALSGIGVYEKTALAENAELLFGEFSEDGQTEPPQAQLEAYGPYFVLRGPDGSLTRGPNLRLKSREDLVRIFEGLRKQQGLGRFVRRANVNGTQVLSVARPKLVEVAAIPGFTTKLPLILQSQIYADLIAKFGDQSDLDWLLGTFYSLSPDVAARTAVEIEIRMGTVNAGRVVQSAHRLDDSGQAIAAIPLVKQLLRSGVPDGFDLARKIRADLGGNSEVAFSFRQFGLAELLLNAGPGLEDEAKDFLIGLTELIEAQFVKPDGYSISGKEFSRSFAVTILYLAKYAPDTYLKVASLPIPTAGKYWRIFDTFTDDLALLSADPIQILDYRFTEFEGPEAVRSLGAWDQDMGRISCNIIDVASPAQQNDLYVSVSNYMASLNRVDSYRDYDQRDGVDQRDIDYAMSVASVVGLSECILQSSLVDQIILSYTNSRPRIDWWSTPDRLAKELSWVYNIEGLEWVSAYSDVDVSNALDQSEFDEQLVVAIKLYHRSVTAAFRAEVEQVTFGAEIRRFRIQNQKVGENSQVMVMGHVSIRPVIQGEKLLVAIKHNILTNEAGGLSAAMGANQRAKFETPNRERMFEFVRLDIGGQLTEGTLTKMGAKNTLLYEFPYQGDFSNVILRIGMQFLEKRWNFDYALYDSQAAYDLRLMGE